MDIPVYLIAGFLDAGKTNVINGVLEDGFAREDRTLLICCEEGEEEYDPSMFAAPNIYTERIEEESQLKPDYLKSLLKKHRCSYVMVEYNGMWLLDDLYNNMPEGWVIYQEICFADANTFLSYNANMRQLMVDKLQGCEMVVFNRVSAQTDKMELHKIARAVSRNVNISYEYTDGTIEYDDIVDPLPFDIEADPIVIADRDFALFFRDLTEDMPAICAHWQKEGLTFDAIYTGYLGSLEQVDIVKNIIETFRKDDTLVIVDPVMADNGEYYSDRYRHHP